MGAPVNSVTKFSSVWVAALAFWILWLAGPATHARPQALPFVAKAPEKVIIDTDIGDDIDDAFALALALRSPELQILGVTTTFGDTRERAKLVDRFLAKAGRNDIPVAAGKPTAPKAPFTQRAYAEGGHRSKEAEHTTAVDFVLQQIQRHPGEITLIAIGPPVNIGDLIDRDPKAFRQLKRVVMMGGSIERGYDAPDDLPSHRPDAEWNIVNDIASSQKLFLSGVPIFLMPLDATQLKLDEAKRAILFRQRTAITAQLTLLYQQWGQQTPTLFDPMTIAFILKPGLCPVKPMRIRVDEKGFTRVEPGNPNAQVCLQSDSDAFFHLYIGRLVGQQASVQTSR